MAEPNDPSATGNASMPPTAADLFDPASFALRLADARERRARALEARRPQPPASAPPETTTPPAQIRRLHRGFALGALLGLAVAAVPAASFLRTPAAPAPVAALSVRTPARPASTRAPHLPPEARTSTAHAEPAHLDAPAPSQFLSPEPVSPIPDAASRPLPRPELVRIARADARMSARNRSVAPSLPGLVSTILGQLNVSAGSFRPRQTGDGPAPGSIRFPALPAKAPKKNGKSAKSSAGSGKHTAAAKGAKSHASRGGKPSRKH